MGVLYSMPLCSRGEKGEENGANIDANNNQPMPSLHTDPREELQRESQVVSTQPEVISEIPAGEEVADSRISPESDIFVPEGETGDSGLEQSSSDELEICSALGMRPGSVAVRRKNDDCDHVDDEEEENELPLDDCDDYVSEDETSEEADPIERPPEPTVPDERPEDAVSPFNLHEDVLISRESSESPPKIEDSVKEKMNTQNAISNLFSEIVGQEPSSTSLTR